MSIPNEHADPAYAPTQASDLTRELCLRKALSVLERQLETFYSAVRELDRGEINNARKTHLSLILLDADNFRHRLELQRSFAQRWNIVEQDPSALNRERRKTRKRGRTAIDRSNFYCHQCDTKVTPEWRKGPDGNNTLCNACGLKYAKKRRLENEEIEQQLTAAHQARVRETMSIGNLLN